MNETGKKGEDFSSEYLEKNGYRILERNYHSRYGEIDIIAQKDEEIIFLEVKTRSKKSEVKPCEYVDERKMNKIVKTALIYLGDRADDTLMRFDVIDIIYECGIPMIHHYKNVY